MAVAGSLTYDTKIDGSGFEKGLGELNTKAVAFGNIIADAFQKVASVMTDVVKQGVAYNAQIEQYQVALTTLTGSAEKANTIIDKIKEDASKTPFDVAGLTQANQLLISTGLDSETARKDILALGNAISATGGGSEELSRMAVNLQQIKNVGKASSLDIKQFAFAGIDVYGLLADSMSITREEATNLDVTYEQLTEALRYASEEGGKYYGAMEEQSHTLNGQLSTLKDNFMTFAGEAVEPLFNFLRDTALPILNDLLTGGGQISQWLQENQQLLTVLGILIGTLTTAIIAYNVAQNAAAIATTIATAATTAFGTVMAFITSPITLVVLAIGALIAIIYLLIKNWDAIKEKTLEVWDKIKTALSETIENIIEWFSNLPEKIGFFIGELLGRIIKFGIDAKNWATTKIPEIINSIVNFFKQLPFKIWTHLTNAIQKFKEFLIDMKNRAKEGVQQVGNNIREGFLSIPDKIKEAGKNIVEGLWNGISGAGDWIKNKVGEFAKGILNGMKRALGIHSPSTVFRDEVGKWIPQGIAVGIEADTDSALKALDVMNDEMVSKMNKAVNFEVGKAGTSGITGSVSEILNTNSKIVVENYNTMELDGEKIYENQQTIQKNKNLQYAFGGV